jgi:hypothetical protein
MNKIIFTILSIMVMSITTSSASDKYVNYDDFVHFNYSQQVRTIQLIHEYLVEYEKFEQYQKEDESDKRQTYLKIIDYFISSAYANGSPFSLENISGDIDLCYYAGWMSTTMSYEGKKYCKHPGALSTYINDNRNASPRPSNFSIIEEIHENYSRERRQQTYKVTFQDDQATLDLEETSTCSTQADIVCNPSIYGRIDGNPICVSGNSQQGANSSLLCTQALNILKEQDLEKYDETMNGIINQAISNDAGTRDEFFYTLRSMYDTCLCGSVDSIVSEEGEVRNNDRFFLRSIDAEYANRIFNQRTCFGIINQTQHIFESLRTQSQESALCQRYINTNVNGSSGLNWLAYLDRAYNVIKEQNIDETIQSITSQINGDSFDRGESNRIIQADRDNFTEMRRGHFQTYREENICPLGFEEFVPPTEEETHELRAELINVEGNNDFALVSVKYFHNNEDKTNEAGIALSIQLATQGDVAGSQIEPRTDEGDTEAKFQVTRLDDDFVVIATREVNGVQISSDPLTIPQRPTENGEELRIELSENEGEGEFSLVIVKYFLNGEDKTAEPGVAQSISLSPQGTVTGSQIVNQTNDGDSEAKFRVTRLDDDYTVQAIRSVDDNSVTSSPLTIPKKLTVEEVEDDDVDAGDEIASCEVKLKINPTQNGSFAIAVEVKAPNDDGELTQYPNEENQMPENLNLTWYDSENSSASSPSSSSESSTPQSGNMISEDEDEDDEEQTSEEDSSDELVQRIQDQLPRSSRFNVPSGDQPFSTIRATQGQSARVIAVVMNLGDTCEAGDALTIPPAARPPAPPVNVSPQRLNRRPPRARLPGMILNGNN